MGMECVRSSSPVALSFNAWMNRRHFPFNHPSATDDSSAAVAAALTASPSADALAFMPHSAPSVASVLDGSATCYRRASSFPLAHTAALPSVLKVRSQSESAALNSISIKVPRNLLHELEMCRQKLSNRGSGFTSGVKFYAAVQENLQSDSEGDDSLVSSEEGGSSSSTGCEGDHIDDYVEDDLGVVRDLELDDNLRLVTKKSVLSDSALSLSSSNATATPINSNLESVVSAEELADLVAKCCKSQSTPSIRIEQVKKCVRFADDCGGCLETIRVMTEPSDYPPRVSPSVIRRYRKAAAAAAAASSQTSNASKSYDEDDEDDDDDCSESTKPRSTWKMTFKQPASEYVKFRETLENQKVALENVMLKNEIGHMVGTVKVVNIAFEKRVYIRFTSDGWKSYLDRPAFYQSSPSKAQDTFRFDIELPRNTHKDSRLEFCVCFVANGSDEYWDSNSGKNYVFTSPSEPPPLPAVPAPRANLSSSALELKANGDDVYTLQSNYEWSKFASWKNLSTAGPYW